MLGTIVAHASGSLSRLGRWPHKIEPKIKSVLPYLDTCSDVIAEREEGSSKVVNKDAAEGLDSEDF